MDKINIKPLSCNNAYYGRKVKTKEYREYEHKIKKLLPDIELPDKGELVLKMEVGFSSRASDLGNVEKLFTDCLQKGIGFNDNRIYRIIMDKKIVKKGEEYISFDLSPFDIALGGIW